MSKYKWGDKVSANGKEGIVTRVGETVYHVSLKAEGGYISAYKEHELEYWNDPKQMGGLTHDDYESVRSLFARVKALEVYNANH